MRCADERKEEDHMNFRKIISAAAALSMLAASTAAFADDPQPTQEEYAKELSIDFTKVTSKEYTISVKSDDGNAINRLTSAQLKFVLQSENQISYEIEPLGSVSMTEKGEEYEFNFDGVTDKDSGKVTSVPIAAVKFTGYGTFAFAALKYDEAKVNTTTWDNNIVVTYNAEGKTGDNQEPYDKLNLCELTDEDQDGEIDPIDPAEDPSAFTGEIESEKQDLRINVVFPNNVINQKAAYTDMMLTVAGGDIPVDAEGVKKYEIPLGSDKTAGDLAAPDGTTGTFASAYKTDLKTSQVDEEYSGYAVTLDDVLTKNVSYTVTVTGAGYRTTRYTVLLDAESADPQVEPSKEITFWNNVIDVEDAQDHTRGDFIEPGVSEKVMTNFLAGELVSDNEINIYDLSAVVSYFGSTADSTDAAWGYAKYDLNRDGKIDSKDISYVLVSWGK